jgi:hypothetical protein
MLVDRIVIEGRVCRDMYDEHPGFAYFYVDSCRHVAMPEMLSLTQAQAKAEEAWKQFAADENEVEDFEEYDGQFTPSRVVLQASDGSVLQCFENGRWAAEFDAPDTWDTLLATAKAKQSEASFEAGWDNFGTAETLRNAATALRRRVSMAMAHYGVLPEPPARPPAVKPVRRMRGLDERAAFALARILRLSDVEKAEDDMAAVLSDTESLGISDYHEGVTEPPIMFADEPSLLETWKAGQQWAADLEHMADD